MISLIHKIKKKFYFYNNLTKLIEIYKIKKKTFKYSYIKIRQYTLETISNLNLILTKQKKNKNLVITENKNNISKNNCKQT